jgi:uncharacterized membrane protein (DUF106 family)
MTEVIVMKLLKKYFFVGTCTSGIVIFLYETLRPYDVVINGPIPIIMLLASYALFFTIIGLLTSLFQYVIKTRIIHEDKMEEFDKNRQRH